MFGLIGKDGAFQDGLRAVDADNPVADFDGSRWTSSTNS
jgi:hypothetical protein